MDGRSSPLLQRPERLGERDNGDRQSAGVLVRMPPSSRRSEETRRVVLATRNSDGVSGTLDEKVVLSSGGQHTAQWIPIIPRSETGVISQMGQGFRRMRPRLGEPGPNVFVIRRPPRGCAIETLSQWVVLWAWRVNQGGFVVVRKTRKAKPIGGIKSEYIKSGW